MMTTSEPPEQPEEPPEVEYRRPAWVEPPADLVPGIVPVELILARMPQRAIGLPPPGPLAFVVEWPARGIPETRVEIDASLVLEAADRAAPVWPTG